MRRLLIGMMVVSVILSAPASALASPAAPAGGVVGNGSPASCTQAALHTALTGGGLVTFDCGGPKTIQFSTPETVNLATTIDGAGGIILSGGLTTRLFEVAPGGELTLRNLQLVDAVASGSDGGAVVNHGRLIVEESSFLNNVTDNNHSGGAIFSDGPVSIRDSVLSFNNAGSAGALFANFSHAVVVITNSDFENNRALNPSTGRGGAIWVGEQAHLTLTSGSIQANRAPRGGALYISSGAAVTLTADAQGLGIDDNVAQYEGGGIFNQGASLVISGLGMFDNVVLSDTLGTGYGGAIATYGPLTLRGSTLHGNTAHYGGGLMVSPTMDETVPAVHTVLLDGVRLRANLAHDDGGALYTFSEAHTITITHSLFLQNVAGAGGAIARSRARLSVAASAFISNTADYAGAIYNTESGDPATGGPLRIRDTTFSGNTATNGEGAALYGNVGAELVNVTLAGQAGSAIYNAGVTQTLRLTNTVLFTTGFANCIGPALPQSGGGNFANDTTCGLTAPGDQHGPGLNPLLGPLTLETPPLSYLTYFRLPLPGSPLINTAVAPCSVRDQRGAARPDACDKGAVEFGGLLPRLLLPLVLR
jgi:hypothetical protein